MSGPGGAEPTPSADRWRILTAIGILVGEPTAAALVRHGRLGGIAPVTIVEADAALAEARRSGWIGADGSPTAAGRSAVADVLTETQRLEICVDRALVLLAAGPDHVAAALEPARLAGSGPRAGEVVAALDRAGTLAVSLGDYPLADEVLSLAAELDVDAPGARSAARLCDLAEVAEGQGDDGRARRLLTQAFAVADAAASAAVVARAAVALALLDDGVVADGRAGALLRRAGALALDESDRVSVEAAQALAERRIPTVLDEGRPVVWVTRPGVGRALADAALATATAGRVRLDSRALALRAWRATHQAPAFLHRRCEVSGELLDLTQQLHAPAQQYDAAEWLAVDSLETGDRAGFDRAVDLARWLATRDGNPRLVRRSLLLAAGAAHLDGALDDAARLVERASQLDAGRDPVAALVFATQAVGTAWATDRSVRDLVAGHHAHVSAEPLHRVASAAVLAHDGDREGAEAHLRRALRQLDPEQDLLLVASRMARIAVALAADELCRDLVAVLAPWAAHHAVDGRGWWADGPVALRLAQLHNSLGDADASWRCLEHGDAAARAVNDIRAVAEASVLRAELRERGPAPMPVQLTSREQQVLTLLAAGSTNPQIAQQLAHSVATIRADTIAIYRKLGAKGRAEASARAMALGLISVSRPVGRDPDGRTTR